MHDGYHLRMDMVFSAHQRLGNVVTKITCNATSIMKFMVAVSTSIVLNVMERGSSWTVYSQEYDGVDGWMEGLNAAELYVEKFGLRGLSLS